MKKQCHNPYLQGEGRPPGLRKLQGKQADVSYYENMGEDHRPEIMRRNHHRGGTVGVHAREEHDKYHLYFETDHEETPKKTERVTSGIY